LLTKEVQKSSMSKQTDNKQFWQRWASCYGPLMQSSEPLYAAIAQQMQPHLTPEMNVLELACGSGQLSFRLSRLVRDWEATDFSPKMIAQAKLKPRGVGLHFSVQDATSLPYADETFDAVLIANALHIMPRPEKALAEIYRVLKPGGQLFAPTFVHGEVPRTRLRMLAMRCAGLQIYNSWMVPQYLAFLQAGGFAVIPWPRCAMPALCRTKRA
jgi:ubiquinone/menaquinone biosynthesis C-methylase UbiE